MKSLSDLTDPSTSTLTGIIVVVNFTETPFGGVLVTMPPETVQVDFKTGTSAGGADITATTNLLAGDGAGNAMDSGIVVSDVVTKQSAFPTPTNNMEVVACLQAAGLCA